MAILATERVLTLDWWKPANQLTKGDYVFDCSGELVKVTLVQEYRQEDCYEVTFCDYLTVSGDAQLGFLTEDMQYRKHVNQYKGKLQFRRQLKPMTVGQLLEVPLKDHRDRQAYSVPSTQPLQLPHQDLPVPPFVFGFWFFNRRNNKSLCAPEGMHDEIIEKFKDHGYKIQTGRKVPRGRLEFFVTPTVESQLVPNIPKQIPQNYLLAAPEQRIELLSGIMSAKKAQYNEKRDLFRFTSFHKPTFSSVQQLVESLGSKTKSECHSILDNFSLFFKIKHKIMEKQKPPTKKPHPARRYIKQINKIQGQLCVHIETTSPTGTILVGEGFIPCR